MTGYITEGADLLVWTDDAWLANAYAWIDSRLAELGHPRATELDQMHVRPWGTVIRAGTRAGDVFFKASTDVFEAPLTEAVARWAPQYTVPLLAVDVERNWILTADGGTRLRDLAPGEETLRRAAAALADYADLQRMLAARSNDMLALGVPDQRLETLPAQYEQVVEEVVGLEDGERARLRALAPRFGELCDRLAATGIPGTLQHDEIHDGHIVVREGGYAFFDWAEAVVSHPFLTLRGTLFSLADFFGVERDDRALRWVVDAYLSRWDAEAPLPVVDGVGAVCRALRWHAFVSRMEPPFRERYGYAPAQILRRFFDAV